MEWCAPEATVDLWLTKEENILNIQTFIFLHPPPPYSREVSPSTQRTLDNSQFTMENQSENSSNPSSPEFPATKNRWLWFLTVVI